MDSHDKLSAFVENAHYFLQDTPGIVLVKNLNATCFGISQSLCDLLSVKAKDCIGKEDAMLPWGDFSEALKQHDHAALTEKKVSLIEPLHINKKTIVPIHVVKSIIMDKTGEPIGILAQSNFNNHGNPWLTLSTTLHQKDTKILDTFLSYQIKEYDQTLKLTDREMECLFLLIRGKTAKEIALFLTISFRTVETYIDNLKRKMDVTSRGSIIEKAISMNFVSIIPQNMLLNFLYKDFQTWQKFLI